MQAQSECYFHPYADFCFWFLILLVFVSYFGCFSDGLCCFYGIKNHFVDGLWWSWNWMRLGLGFHLGHASFLFKWCLLLVLSLSLLISWYIEVCYVVYGVLEKLGVSSKWPKVRVLSKMQDLDQLMLNLRCVGLCDWKRSFIWYEYEEKLCMVMLYEVGMYQSVLYTLKKEFELRFGVKKWRNN